MSEASGGQESSQLNTDACDRGLRGSPRGDELAWSSRNSRRRGRAMFLWVTGQLEMKCEGRGKAGIG